MENVTEALTDVALDGMFKHPYSGFTTHSQCPQKHSYSPNMNDIEGSSHFDEEKEIRDARLPSSNQIAPNLRIKHCIVYTHEDRYEHDEVHSVVLYSLRTDESHPTAPLFLDAAVRYHGVTGEDQNSWVPRPLFGGCFDTLEPELLPGHGKARKDELEHCTGEDADCDISYAATYWPMSTFGEPFILEQSDLPQRFPTIFPRFSNDGFSSLLRTTGDTELPFLEYSTYEIPLEACAGVEIDSDDAQDGDNNHRSKRTKSHTVQPHNTFAIRAPTLRARLVRLPNIIDRLKDVALPTTSKTGYIATLFGGVLHLSYPPSGDELVLYSHVVYLHQLFGTDGRDTLATLRQTLEAFESPQHPSINAWTLEDATLSAIDMMFVCAWIDCKQNANLLSLLKPILSRPEDHARIGRLIGPAVALDLATFVSFCAYRTETAIENLRSWRTELDEAKSYFENQLNVRYPHLTEHEYCSNTTSTKDSIDWASRTDCRSKSTDPVPHSIIAISSSLPPTTNNDADTTHLDRIEAHADLVYLRWPYMKKVLDSGLSESRTRVITLPLSKPTIEAILVTLYTQEAPALSPSTAVELLENCLEFELFDRSELDNRAPKNLTSIETHLKDYSFKNLTPLALAVIPALFVEVSHPFQNRVATLLPSWARWYANTHIT